MQNAFKGLSFGIDEQSEAAQHIGKLFAKAVAEAERHELGGWRNDPGSYWKIEDARKVCNLSNTHRADMLAAALVECYEQTRRAISELY